MAQASTGLVKIMAKVPTDDRSLVDLYANRGGADPLLIACALDGQARDSVYLDSPEWVVVTATKRCGRRPKSFGLTVLSNAEFALIVDAAESQSADESWSSS